MQNSKEQVDNWIKKYLKEDTAKIKERDDKYLIADIIQTDNELEQQVKIKFTGKIGELQPIAQKEHEMQIDLYIQALTEFLELNLSFYTFNDINKLNVVFTKYFMKIYTYNLRNHLKDLIDKKTKDQYIISTLQTLAEMQYQEIKKLEDIKPDQDTDVNIGYYNFIYGDIEELLQKNEFNCVVNKTALLNARKELKKIIDGLKEDARKDFLNGKNLLENNEKRFDFYTMFIILLCEKQKPYTTKLVDQDIADNYEYYTNMHTKIIELDKLIKSANNKITEDLKKSKNNYATNNIAKNYNYIDNRVNKNITKIINKKPQAVDLALDTPNIKKHKKRIQTPIVITLNIDKDLCIDYDDRITAMDRLVLNRAFSLWQVNKTHIDAELIYKDIKGDNIDLKKISKDICNKINNSIDKLSTSRISINIENPETIQRLGLDSDNIERIKKESYILPLDKTEIRYKNGISKESYDYSQEPIYFTLANAVGQIKSIPRDYMLLNKTNGIKQKNKTTTATILIDDALARTIELIKSTKGNIAYKNANILLYDKILEECEVLKDMEKGSSKYKTYKNRYTEHIDLKIQDYKERKLIKNYKYYTASKTSKRVKGYIIYV